MTVTAAPDQRAYRIGRDDGTWSAHTWAAAKNTNAATLNSWALRVRVQVRQPNATNWAQSPRIHIRRGAAANPWNSLPVTAASATTTTGSFYIYDSTGETNNTAVTATACGSDTITWQNGAYWDTQNPGAAQANLNAEYTEFEFSVKGDSTTQTQSTFFFRLTNDGTVYTTYTRLADIRTRGTAVTVSSFASLFTAAGLKELGAATLNVAANIVSASNSSFTVLQVAGQILQYAADTLQAGASIKELGAATLNALATIKEYSFATLAASGTLKETGFWTLQGGGNIKELGFSALNTNSVIGAAAGVGKRKKQWPRRRPMNHRFLAWIRGFEG